MQPGRVTKTADTVPGNVGGDFHHHLGLYEGDGEGLSGAPPSGERPGCPAVDGTSSPDKSAGHAGQCGQAAPGARRLGWRCGAGAEFRWRDESVGQAAARPLVGCVRIGEHGAQGRFKVLLDRIREPVPGLAGKLSGLAG